MDLFDCCKCRHSQYFMWSAAGWANCVIRSYQVTWILSRKLSEQRVLSVAHCSIDRQRKILAVMLISLNVKKNCSLYIVNGDGSKHRKNHKKVMLTAIASPDCQWMSMLSWLTLPFCDFTVFDPSPLRMFINCSFLHFIFAVLFPVFNRLSCNSTQRMFFFGKWTRDIRHVNQ